MLDKMVSTILTKGRDPKVDCVCAQGAERHLGSSGASLTSVPIHHRAGRCCAWVLKIMLTFISMQVFSSWFRASTDVLTLPSLDQKFPALLFPNEYGV